MLRSVLWKMDSRVSRIGSICDLKPCAHQWVTGIFSKRYGLSENPLFRNADWSLVGLSS
jgi:hypothetical protein